MEKIKKENKEEIMKRIEEAGDPENYETSWSEEGIPISKKRSEIKKGKKSKAKGLNFERKVRKHLELKGRIIDKWSNNVEFERKGDNQIIFSTGKLIPSKKIFNPFKKIMVPGAGFPDFISIKHVNDDLYSVIGVEAKTNGILSRIEKQKCEWYLKNKIFSQIWIAKKGKKRGEIKYDDFKEKYGKKHNNL